MTDSFDDYDDVVTIHAHAIKDTGLALICQVDGQSVVIPKSQIREASEVKKEGDEGDLVIPEWLAAQKGLA